MIKFIKKVFNTFKNKITIFILTREFDKEVDDNINRWYTFKDSLELENDVQQKYAIGLARIGRRLKNKASQLGLSVEEVAKKEELVALAEDLDIERLRKKQILYATLVKKEADIKTEHDKNQYINFRIGCYLELQKHKQARELLRKARQAYRNGDLELHKTLMQEWNNKYGKSRFNKRQNTRN